MVESGVSSALNTVRANKLAKLSTLRGCRSANLFPLTVLYPHNCSYTDFWLCHQVKLVWPVDWVGSLVDKHSTGGVGDKAGTITEVEGCLVVAPAKAVRLE